MNNEWPTKHGTPSQSEFIQPIDYMNWKSLCLKKKQTNNIVAEWSMHLAKEMLAGE